MISRIYAQVLEEVKRLGGALSLEQEIALEEVHKSERGEKTWKKPTLTSTLG